MKKYFKNIKKLMFERNFWFIWENIYKGITIINFEIDNNKKSIEPHFSDIIKF